MTKLKELREQRKWSQVKLANEARVSLGVIQKLEQPLRVTRRSAEKIAAAFGVSPEEIDEVRAAYDPGEDGDGD